MLRVNVKVQNGIHFTLKYLLDLATIFLAQANLHSLFYQLLALRYSLLNLARIVPTGVSDDARRDLRQFRN